MKRQLAENPAAHQRFLREARAMAAVHSEHIVTIHEVGEQNGLPYMAMELLRGAVGRLDKSRPSADAGPNPRYRSADRQGA